MRIFNKPIKEVLKFEPLSIESWIDLWLDKHSITELYTLIDSVVERKAHRETPEFAKKLQRYVQRHISHNYNYKPKLKNVDGSIKAMENKCIMLQKLLKRTNLNHLERTALLFLYLPFGKKGEARLYEIMSWQKNFKENITKSQIESYKKKNKTLGISCTKLKEWGLCHYDC